MQCNVAAIYINYMCPVLDLSVDYSHDGALLYNELPNYCLIKQKRKSHSCVQCTVYVGSNFCCI